MSIVLTLIRKNFALFLRDRTALILTFLVPIAMTYVFGAVFGVTGKDSGPWGIPLAVVNESADPAATRLIDSLRAEKGLLVITTRKAADGTEQTLTEADLRPMMRDNKFRFALIIPKDIIREDSLGIHLKVLSNPRNEIEAQTVSGLLQKNIFSNVPQFLGQAVQNQSRKILGDTKHASFNHTIADTVANTYGGDAGKIYDNLMSGNFFGQDTAKDNDPEFRELGVDEDDKSAIKKSGNPLAEMIKIENEQVIGRAVKNPMATRSVGGWAITFLMFSLTHCSIALFDEKKSGIFQRYLSGPVRRGHILYSQFLFGTILGLIQLLALFFAGRIMFGIDISSNFGNLVVVCVLAAAAFNAFGMLIASVARTPASGSSLATFLILIMSCVGGAWFPTTMMPGFMQTISKYTITYWAMEGFSDVLWAGASFAHIIPILGILAGIAIAVLAAALWRFRTSPLFD